MRYDAITFDTTTIISNGFKFDKGLLAQLKQFSSGPTEVIISEIVERELLRHLTDATRKAHDDLIKATKIAAELGLINNAKQDYINHNSKPEYLAKRRLNHFFRQIGATSIPVDAVNAKQLINLYFDSAPPFAHGKKKNEFPDAIALLSLQEWAYRNDKMVIAVSGDSDWAAFGVKSDRITVVASLAEGLSILQKNVDEANAVVCRVLHAIVEDRESEKPCGLWKDFCSKIEHQIPQQVVDATADSSYQIEMNGVYVELENVGFEGVAANRNLYLESERPPGPPYKFYFTVVQGGPNKISAEVSIKLLVAVNANISFTASDQEEEQNSKAGLVPFRGTKSVYRMIDTDAVILMTIEGEFNLEGAVTLTDLEIIEFPECFDLGQVEPDSPYEDYDNDSPEDARSTDGDNGRDEEDKEPLF